MNRDDMQRLIQRQRTHSIAAMIVLTLAFALVLGARNANREAEIKRQRAFAPEFIRVFPSVPKSLP